MEGLTARRARANSSYYIIYLNDRAWRVCHEANLQARYPGITIL